MKNLLTCGASFVVIALGVTGANAQDDFLTGNDAVHMRGGFGILAIKANSYVYNGAGSNDKISRLTWESVAPMLTTSLDVTLPAGWTLDVEAQVGLAGDSYMEDFDWLGGSFAEEDWTHRSQHDDTNLDWYFNGSMKVGHDFKMEEGITVNLNGGLKYIDVQWSGFGGSYIYSRNGFRDTPGSFAPGQAVITYRQQLPAVFLGVDTEIVQGAWTFDMAAKAGVTINPSEADNHWLRDIVFADDDKFSPMVALAARVEYEMADNMSVFVAGTVDQVFNLRGDTSITGATNLFFPDASGMDLLAASLSLGLKGTF
jgi:outer membrane protease